MSRTRSRRPPGLGSPSRMIITKTVRVMAIAMVGPDTPLPWNAKVIVSAIAFEHTGKVPEKKVNERTEED